VKGRFSESFPLLQRPETLARLRALVSDAQAVEQSLTQALMLAHNRRKQGGLAYVDAQKGFWSSSEAPFWRWLQMVTSAAEPSAESVAEVEHADRDMRARLRQTAFENFDAHVALSEFEPRKAERVARARRYLMQSLRPRSVPRANPHAFAIEVCR